MKISKSIILLAAVLLTTNFSAVNSAAQVAKQRSPYVLVVELYRQSGSHRSPFFQTRNRALVNKYFDKQLGDLIWKDAIRSREEVGAIDGDPLYNAQDMEIKHFVIHKPDFANGHAGNAPGGRSPGNAAQVKVTFENFGKKEEIVFILSSRTRDSGWKITNIKYNDGTDLLGILKGSN